jgi:hypothetical protein
MWTIFSTLKVWVAIGTCLTKKGDFSSRPSLLAPSHQPDIYTRQ